MGRETVRRVRRAFLRKHGRGSEQWRSGLYLQDFPHVAVAAHVVSLETASQGRVTQGIYTADGGGVVRM